MRNKIKKAGPSKWLIIGGLAVLVLWVISVYNSVVTLNQDVLAQWGNVENAYQSRMDKTKGLLEIVKGAANFEKSTLESVIEARAKATSIQLSADDLTEENLAKFQAAQDQLGSSLSRLMAVAENYPELQAVKGFQDFQTQYEGMENRIATERKRYNDEVRNFNGAIVVFPKSLIAGIFNFKEKPYFKSAEGADVAPDMDFGF